MSQTETLLLFVLGFLAALFVVLLFGRGVWSIFGNFNSWREQRRQPAVIRELQAERDSLKAEKAIMAQKLEASLNDMKMRMAEQMAEVARNRNRLLDMETTLRERENTIAQQSATIDERSTRIGALELQIEENVKAINLAYAKMAQRENEHGQMQDLLKQSQSTLVMRDGKIRNLTDEAKALRDIVTLKPMALEALTDRMEQATPAQQFPFAASMSADIANNDTPTNMSVSRAAPGNPFIDYAESASEDMAHHMTSENDTLVDRSVSNVLSLAERVRNLQTGMKKA